MSAADNGAVWSSVTQLGAGGPTAHFVLAINVTRPWVLQRGDLWPRLSPSSTYLSRPWGRAAAPCATGSLAVASGCVAASPPDGSSPLPDVRSRCANASGTYAVGESPFALVAIHEVPASGWVVWEEDKYVALSRQRFLAVGALGGAGSSGLRVELRGAAGEVVKLVALRPGAAAAGTAAAPAAAEWTVVSVHATIGADGTASVAIQ